MRIARWIAAILFLLPLAQLARAQQMDAKSIAELRGFRLSDDVMRRYDDLVRASTASRQRHPSTEACGRYGRRRERCPVIWTTRPPLSRPARSAPCCASITSPAERT